MDTERLERNVTLYYWYTLLREPLFWGPFIILYITKIGGMTLSEFYTMEGVVVALIILLEGPSGACADIFGRKKTMLFGVLCLLGSVVWFALVENSLDVWCSNILWSFGMAFCSGADEALFRDSLKALKRESEHRRICGLALSNRMLLIAVCALIAGVLADSSLRLPIYCSVPGVFGLCIITFLFYEPPVEEKQPATIFTLLKESAHYLYKSSVLWWATCFLFLISASSQLWFFTYNPYFELVELDVWWYGVIFFALNVVAWFFSKNAHTIGEKIDDQCTYGLIVASVGIPMLVMGVFVHTWAVSMVIFQNFSRGVLKPFISSLTNDHTTSERRATVLSTQNAISSLGYCISLFVFSRIVDAYQVPRALQMLSVTVLVFGIIAIIRYRSLVGK